MAEIYIYYSLLGMVAGLLAGLFGVGGGLIIVPALYYLLLAQDVNEQVVMHIAIGTSLATIILTSISSAFSHYRQQAIVINAFLFLAPGLVLGAAMSAVIADYLAKDYLVVIFALFEIAVAVQMGMALKMNAHRQLPRVPAVATAGVGIGLLSGLVGIGGGSLTVPYLSWHNVPIKKAIGTSAACGLPIAVAGMAGFLLAGIDNVNLPAYTTGYILWPAFFSISLLSVMFAPLGAKLAHRLPSAKLKRGFAIFLGLIGTGMLYTLLT